MAPYFREQQLREVYEDYINETYGEGVFEQLTTALVQEEEDTIYFEEPEEEEQPNDDNWNRIQEALDYQVEQENDFYSPEAIEMRREIQAMDIILGAHYTVDHSIPTGDPALDDDDELADCLLPEAPVELTLAAEEEENNFEDTTEEDNSDDEMDTTLANIDFSEEIFI